MRIDKNQNTNSKKIRVLIASIIVAVLLLGGTLYALMSPRSPFYLGSKIDDNPENTVDYSEPTDTQKQAGEDAKKRFNEEKYPADNSPDESYTNSTSVTITSAQQWSDILSVRVMINAINDMGGCTLKMTHDGRELVKKADTQSMGSYSVCKGFDIVKSELQPGEWTLSVSYSDSTGAKGSVTQKVTVD